MPSVSANPMVLSWDDFFVVPGKITDPQDGSPIDALTSFRFDMEDLAPTEKGGLFSVPDDIVITIFPDCQVSDSVKKTAALLAHEQLHYDVGIMCARAFARQIGVLAAPSKAALQSSIAAARTLHFTTRARILQKRYDIDTDHGTIEKYQVLWKQRMAAALASPKADTIGGFYF